MFRFLSDEGKYPPQTYHRTADKNGNERHRRRAKSVELEKGDTSKPSEGSQVSTNSSRNHPNTSIGRTPSKRRASRRSIPLTHATSISSPNLPKRSGDPTSYLESTASENGKRSRESSSLCAGMKPNRHTIANIITYHQTPHLSQGWVGPGSRTVAQNTVTAIVAKTGVHRGFRGNGLPRPPRGRIETPRPLFNAGWRTPRGAP